MVPGGPAHPGAEAVGDPDRRADIAEEPAHHRLAARRADHEAGAVGVAEHPGPGGLLANAHAGLVGGQHRAGQWAPLDQAGLRREGGRAVLQQVGQRPLADLQPEQVTHQPRQALEREGLAEAQVEHEGAQVGAERRARLQPGRGGRLEAPGAARAHAAVQDHPRHVRGDLGDLDAVVGLHRRLGHVAHVGVAVGAMLCAGRLVAGRIGMQRPVRSGVHPELGAGLAIAVRLAPLRGWRARVVRRLRRRFQLLP
jgi:hypothetical protein